MAADPPWIPAGHPAVSGQGGNGADHSVSRELDVSLPAGGLAAVVPEPQKRAGMPPYSGFIGRRCPCAMMQTITQCTGRESAVHCFRGSVRRQSCANLWAGSRRQHLPPAPGVRASGAALTKRLWDSKWALPCALSALPSTWDIRRASYNSTVRSLQRHKPAGSLPGAELPSIRRGTERSSASFHSSPCLS